jgi:hypothetical protein
VIVSCLPDEQDKSSPSGWKYYYGCSTLLEKSKCEKIELSLDTEESRGILQSLLRSRNRRLTDEQLDYALESIKVEPTALCVQLVARVVQGWTSSQSPSGLELGRGVSELIRQVFAATERKYGPVLTRAACMLVTFAMEGVTDNEVVDMLSLDEQVMSKDGVNKYNTAKRLPPHVWLRLRAELYGLFTERAGNCIKWYHRQLQEVSQQRYSAQEKRKCICLMAQYFSNLIPEDRRRDLGVCDQPVTLTEQSVWFHDAVINNRRCAEAPLLLEQGHGLDGTLITDEMVVTNLCDLDFIAACVKRGQGAVLVGIFGRLADKLRSRGSSYYTRVYHYYRWLAGENSFIGNSIQKLVASAFEQPKISEVRMGMGRLLSGPQFKPCQFSENSLIVGRTLGGRSDFDAQIMNLRGM